MKNSVRATPSGSILAPEVDEEAQATPVEAGAPEPDLTKTGEAIERETTRSVGITILAVLAVLYTLYIARVFLLPITFALLLNFLLSPVVRVFERIRLPTPLGAAVVLAVLLGAVGLGASALSGPAQEWISKAPKTLTVVTARLRALGKPVEQVSKTAEQMERATGVTSGPQPQEVVVTGPSIMSRVFGGAETFLIFAVQVVILLYFLLAGGDVFLQKLIKVLPRKKDKRTAVAIARETEASISTYLFSVALINVGEGLAVAGVMWALSMPNALLWGSLAALLEFVPYIGAAVMVVVLTLAGLTTFTGVGHALLVPGSFLLVSVVQANLVSPVLLSRRLTLNPVAMLVGLALWVFLWGIPGAFIAVPLLATFKIFCDHIEALAPVGEFLGKRDD
jgi:predicted PurR-regulated permease PerM